MVLLIVVSLLIQNRSRAQLLMELSACLTEFDMASKHGRATRKISRRGTWLPIGVSRCVCVCACACVCVCVCVC